MSYPDPQQNNFLEDLLRRKEFYRNKADPSYNYRDPPGGTDPYIGKYLKLHSYQLFVRDFMSPNTKYRSVHLQFQTGTGKTLVACGTAHEHARIYKSIYSLGAARAANNRRLLHTLDRTTPSIIVLGFGGTKKAFMRDLMKYPEFGFISSAELLELASRRRAAESGIATDISAAREYQTMLRKRITTKQRGGFYRFFGYDEFVNRLFTTISIKLVDVEAETLSRLRVGEDITHDQVFLEYIKSGKITVNMDFLLSLRNNFIIADEIHNTYNTIMRNNRGVALQYVLDNVETIRLMTLSATPANNSPTEIVELINYHVPKEDRITKHQIFSNSRTLREGALDKIVALMRGRWSFLQDANVKYFPRQIFHGEDVLMPQTIGSVPAGHAIPYLKFTTCEMSPLHAATLAAWRERPSAKNKHTSESIIMHVDDINDDQINIAENLSIMPELTDASSDLSIMPRPTDTHTSTEPPTYLPNSDISADDIAADNDLYEESLTTGIPADGVTIYDGVFPNPDSDTIGLFRSIEARAKIASAPREWLDKIRIGIRKTALGWAFTGEFLRADQIGKYCTKAVKILEIMDNVFLSSGSDPNKCQKVMIYHDRVKMMGVMFWAELLRTNGFIDEWSYPVDATRCVVCGIPLGRHSAEGCKDYHPARFVVVHSDIDKLTMDTSINKFIQPENAHGLQYMVLIGSKIIKESYDIKDVQVFIQTSVTVNFSTQLQIFGRTARKGSHLNLPEDQRRVNIHILLSTNGGQLTPEIQKYADKASDYMIIQQIERELNARAIDANINRDIIMSDELMKKYIGPDGKIQPVLGNLYFDPVDKLPAYSASELNLSTWTAYGYNVEETKTIIVILKRLFATTPVWTWDGIVAAVHRPSVGLEVNPALFSDSNIIIAVRFMVSPRNEVVQLRGNKTAEFNVVEHLFDNSDRYIYVDGRQHTISHRGKYYVRTPVQTWNIPPKKSVISRDQEHLLISNVDATDTRNVVTDLAWLSWSEQVGPVITQTDDWLLSHNTDDVFHRAFTTVMSAEYIIDDRFIFQWPFHVQIRILENAIAQINNLSDNLPNERAAQIIALFDGFGAIIRQENLIAADTALGATSGVDFSIPIGYHDKRRIRILDNADGSWTDRPKSALKKRPSYVENDILVGYVEMFDNEVRFKIRKPAQQIRKEVLNLSVESGRRKTVSKRVSNADTRFMERGAVCVTKSKSEMIKYAANLGAVVAQFDSTQRVKSICDIILARLIAKELDERKKGSKIKFFYGWWDEMPTLTIF